MRTIISNYAWIEKASLYDENNFTEKKYGKHETIAKKLFLIKEQCLIVPKNVKDESFIDMSRETRTHVGIPRFLFSSRSYREHNIEYRVSDGREITKNLQPISLRDYDQEPLVQEMVRALTLSNPHYGGGLMQAFTGFGKCQGKDGKVLMHNGRIKNVMDVKPGNLLMGQDSKPRKVENIVKGRGKMYKITPTKGESWTCNEDHILSLKVTNAGKNAEDWLAKLGGQILNMTLKEYLDLPAWAKHRLKLYRTGVEFSNKVELNFDPYVIGLWLGDGTRRNTQFTNPEIEIKEYLQNYAVQVGLKFSDLSKDNECPVFSLIRKDEDLAYKNSLHSEFQKCFIDNEKRIPHAYKCSNRINRLRLLAGMLDTDSHLVKNTVYEITTKYDGLKDDILFLARSLGLAAYAKRKKGVIKKINFEGWYWRIFISGETSEIPCKVERKIAKKREQKKSHLVTGFNVEYIGIDNYYGFNLDQDHLYVMNDFTVTHNSVCTIELIQRLGRNAIILVHSEPLRDQWINNIKEFFPNAKIGKIQQDVCEYENCDIVVALVQSLMHDAADEKYPKELFSYFGTLMVDEVHRMGSRAFGKAAPKFNCKYTVGMSGTIRRKDKCENVFKWVLGDIKVEADERFRVNPVIFVRDTHFEPIVRENFVEDKKTGKKKLKVFDMQKFEKATQLNFITKNKHSLDRTKGIALDICKALKTGRNPLVMSERKDVFYDIAAYIDHFAKKILPGRKISHGYYLGGKNKKTREKELSEAANCDVVYATIQLAKEGINIPRLDTLHMITPLTDVEQMIGRVCRPNIGWDANGKPYLKPRKNNSMVVDYVDFKLKNFNDSFQQRFKQYVSLGWKVINERRVLNEGRKEE